MWSSTGQKKDSGSSCNSYKLVMLGETTVGKSSIVKRFVKDHFDPFSESTIGAAFLTKAVSVASEDETKPVKFEIWDTAGQERYRSLAPMYYRGAQAVVLVYDITVYDSFLKAKNWFAEINKHRESNNIVIALVGNKTDLEHQRKVSREEGEAYAVSNDMMFMETSAKTPENVMELFHEVGFKLLTGDYPLVERGESVGSTVGTRESIDLSLGTYRRRGYSCCN